MAFNLQLQPTPKRSPYVEQLLEPTQIQAFSKGPQIQEAILKALSQGLSGYFAGRERRRSEGVRDRLRDVIAGAKAPSGWVNPDAGWVPPEGVVDASVIGPGGYLPQEEKALGFRRMPRGDVIPESQRGAPDYRLTSDLARQIVPLRPDDPKGTVLADPTQIRGKEALFSAIATDPQLQSLVGSDIDTLTQVMMADLMQGQPRMLNSQELQDLGFAAGTVAQVNPDGTYNIIQDPPTPVKPTETFQQMSSERLHQVFPDTFSAEFVEENAGKMWNYSDKNNKVTALGGAGQTINVGGDKNYFTKKFEEGVAVSAEEALEKARILGESAETLSQMLAFFDDPEFGTGRMDEFMMPLQQWGRSLGLDIEEKEIATKETFQAKAKQLVLKQVEFMKGALSNKELNFLEEQVAGLGKTRGGNKLILWLGKSTAAKAAAFARYARNWRSDEGKRFYKVGAEGWNDMMADWEKSETYTMTPKEYIMELAETDEELWRSEKVPEDEIANRLENRYSLSLFGQVFRDY